MVAANASISVQSQCLQEALPMNNSRSSPDKRITASSIIIEIPWNAHTTWSVARKGAMTMWQSSKTVQQKSRFHDGDHVRKLTERYCIAPPPHTVAAMRENWRFAMGWQTRPSATNKYSADTPTPVGGNGSQDFWCIVTVTYRDHTVPIDSPHFITNAYSLRDTSRGCSKFINSTVIWLKYLYSEYTIIYQRMIQL